MEKINKVELTEKVTVGDMLNNWADQIEAVSEIEVKHSDMMAFVGLVFLSGLSMNGGLKDPDMTMLMTAGSTAMTAAGAKRSLEGGNREGSIYNDFSYGIRVSDSVGPKLAESFRKLSEKLNNIN